MHASYLYGFAKIVSVPCVSTFGIEKPDWPGMSCSSFCRRSKRLLRLGFTYNRVFPKTGIPASVRVWAFGVNPQCVGPLHIYFAAYTPGMHSKRLKAGIGRDCPAGLLSRQVHCACVCFEGLPNMASRSIAQ